MAGVGLAGTEIGLSSVDNKVNSVPPGKKETGSSDGLFTLWDPAEPTIPELEYVCPSSVPLKAKLSDCISIVFVHGLQGHTKRTWATSKLCWPVDLLPQDLPCARIMAFGYNKLVMNEPPPQFRDLRKTLLDSLTINRRLTKAGSRPLIFITHSLGGLIVKRVQNPLALANSSDTDVNRLFYIHKL